MKKIVAIMMVMLMVMSVTVVVASGVADKDTKVPVIIGFKDVPSQADKGMIQGQGGDIKYSYTIINAIAAKIPEQAIDNIKKNPKVAYVEPDAKVYALDTELNNSWGVKRIGAGDVHDGGNTGAGVKVAIIDSGIDYTHSDLDDNYIGGLDYVNNDFDPMDDNGHGTHCAGIVAAEDNGEGVVGVAPEVHLYAVKVLDNTGSGSLSNVIAGIQWSVDNDMQVISMSLGTRFDYQPLHDTCDVAYNAGLVVVAAAGNSGVPRGRATTTVGYPARYNSVIAVSATGDTDTIASFSSRGSEVELAAPGVSIYSTVPGGYDTYSGTSMACPHVAGTVALVIASGITDENGNSRINDDVRTRLRDTAEDLGNSGNDDLYGHGLVDAFEAASGEDTTLPAVSDLTPANGAFVNTETPIISATVTDASGIDESSIVMTVDGATFDHLYDSGTGKVSNTTTTLTEGYHTVALEVSDTKGNLASASWSFTVDITPPGTINDLTASTEEYPDINLLWSSATDNFEVSYYNIYRDTDSSISKTTDLLATTTVTSYTDSTGDAEITYYFAVCVVDSAGNEAVLSNIAGATVASTPDNTMYVASIEMDTDSRSAGRNTFVWAVANVTIVDANGNLVDGATVYGNWSGLTSGGDLGQTGGDGTVVLNSDSVKNAAGTFTFTVTNVEHSELTYESSEDDWASTTV